jgi:hypothetical protein
MLPASEYAAYLSRLITLFKAETGPMFEIFANNFVYLIGLGSKIQNKSSQEIRTATTAFQRLMETKSRDSYQ